MIDSAFDTAGSASPRSQPFGLCGSCSTYSRIACARNSSASFATISAGGVCSATNRSELSSHCASPRDQRRLLEPLRFAAGDVERENRRQRIEERVGIALRRAKEAAPDFVLRT